MRLLPAFLSRGAWRRLLTTARAAHAGRRGAIAALVVVPIATGAWTLQRAAEQRGAALLEQVMTLVMLRYADTLSAQALYERAARGVVRELQDPYSELLTPADLADFERTTNGNYSGLGVLLTPPVNGAVTIEKVYDGTPAAEAGVQPGDRIVRIDDSSSVGWSTERVHRHLVGQDGTPVVVHFERAGFSEPLTHRFLRRRVHVSSVPFHLQLTQGVGYVPITRFGEHTAQELRDALVALRAGGSRGVVLDLRGNPGGVVEEALATANLFLPRGAPLLEVRSREGTQRFGAELAPLVQDVPLVVLLDGGSASSSEIVAGALKDNRRALLVGSRSYGKGLVQTVYGLDEGYALKITTGRWYTPSGRSISKLPDGTGAISPDVAVADDTLTSGERALREALAPHAGAVYSHMTSIAQSAVQQRRARGAAPLRPGFAVDSAWGDSLFVRLRADNVPLTRAQFDAGRADIDRSFAQRVATLAQGDTLAFRVTSVWDAPLQRAVQLLERSATTAELLRAAPRPAGSGDAGAGAGAGDEVVA
ncbi:MAG: PDZ domain-containing protein [Gemmatimonadetes bacterium]|nr:PDZ domain-containing protein [Gemmatimonadota bacterium]